MATWGIPRQAIRLQLSGRSLQSSASCTAAPRRLVTSQPCSGCWERRFRLLSQARKRKSVLLVVPFARLSGTCRLLAPSAGQDPVQSADIKASPPAPEASSPEEAKLKSRPKIDFSQSYTANIFITPLRAMTEYVLDSSDLDPLVRTRKRSPYPEKEVIVVYLRRDVENIAINKWGSLEKVQKERKRIAKKEWRDNAYLFVRKKAKSAYLQQHEEGAPEKPYIFKPTPIPGTASESIFQSGSGKVVVYAVTINAANCIMKLAAWIYTGSHSMFSEFIHSFADTVNQIILAVGLHQSLKLADMDHPYGWGTFRNISSLISGVGIFCMGAGLSWYHGIMGLLYPEEMPSLLWAIAILGGSFISEGATLLVAYNHLRSSAKAQEMGMMEYIYRSQDPSTNVVLLEDMAAVLGVSIAAGCMAITSLTGNPIPDAVGSLLIGTLLGGVASFIIYTNTIALVGRSIPSEKRLQLMKELESDRMIRTLHDVKATDLGGFYVRFKAEVDFDGKELTRFYLEKQDLDILFKEIKNFQGPEDLEAFMLTHGENIVDSLGGEVDRIEKTLKKKHPEVRHVDLEQL